jgi:hypothetical protein
MKIREIVVIVLLGAATGLVALPVIEWAANTVSHLRDTMRDHRYIVSTDDHDHPLPPKDGP